MIDPKIKSTDFTGNTECHTEPAKKHADAIFSWIFLFLAIYAVIAGVLLLKKEGKIISERNDDMLYPFEKTSVLVDQGIFR